MIKQDPRSFRRWSHHEQVWECQDNFGPICRPGLYSQLSLILDHNFCCLQLNLPHAAEEDKFVLVPAPPYWHLFQAHLATASWGLPPDSWGAVRSCFVTCSRLLRHRSAWPLLFVVCISLLVCLELQCHLASRKSNTWSLCGTGPISELGICRTCHPVQIQNVSCQMRTTSKRCWWLWAV